jgi:hypothetical protein
MSVHMDRRLKQAVMLIALSTLGAAANATVLSYTGTFSGTVQSQIMPLNMEPPHPESYWDGAAVTGSFDVQVVDPQMQFPGGFLDRSGQFQVSYLINGQTFQYGGSVIELAQDGATQSVSFLTDFITKYGDFAGVSFSGPALFTNFDPKTISLTNGNSIFTTGFEDIGQLMYFAVDVKQSNYGPVSTVPEPSTFALFGLGALALVAKRRRAS